jgi:hypothetical protein
MNVRNDLQKRMPFAALAAITLVSLACGTSTPVVTQPASVDRQAQLEPSSPPEPGDILPVVDAPPSTGDIYIVATPGEWVVNGGDEAVVIPYNATVHLRASAPGIWGFSVGASLPSMLFGQFLQFKGVRFCYTALANASIDVVAARLWSATNGVATEVAMARDETDRTDEACRDYLFESPVYFVENSFAGFSVGVNFAGTTDAVKVSSTTFILAPAEAP